MSLLKVLQIGNNQMQKYNKEYLLKDYKCHVCRRHNEYRAIADKYCERIDLTIATPGREDIIIHDWFINQSIQSGRILIELPPNAKQSTPPNKEILFEDAKLFSLEEEFHFEVDEVRILKVSLVAEEVTINGVKFNKI